MNILIVTTSFPCKKTKSIGGKFVLYEALAYAKNGANVKVVTPHFFGAPKKETTELGVEVIRFRYFWPFRLQKIIDPVNPIYQNRNKLLKLLNLPFFIIAFLIAVLKHSYKADIIHCQWTITVLFALPARLLWGCKVITTARGSDIRLFPEWLNRFIMRKVNASIDCYGEGWFDTLKKFPSNYIKLPLITFANNIKEIPRDLKSIFENNKGAFKIVYLGRFDQVKKEVFGFPFMLLIQSVYELKKTGYKILLVYIGSGDMGQEMKKEVRRLNLENEIMFLGVRENSEDYLRFFDLGLGGVATNAVSQEMAFAGIPQVQIDYTIQNPTTIWTDKKNMLLFERNNVASLTENIKFAIDFPDKMQTIAKNSKEHIKKYVVDYMEGGKKYLSAFDKLLQYQNDRTF